MLVTLYLTNSNFLNSCFKGEPMRIIYRMRGTKSVFVLISLKYNFDVLKPYSVHLSGKPDEMLGGGGEDEGE